MNKTELIAAIAKTADCENKLAHKILDATLTEIVAALKSGEEVKLTGFGSFKISDRAARTGRNPQTGEAINIAASKVPSFKAGKELKDAINT